MQRSQRLASPLSHCSQSGSGVIVVDAPPSIAPNVLAAIKSVTDSPITHVVYSHAHADHIAGAGKYPASATYIAHTETKKDIVAVRKMLSLVFFFALNIQVPFATKLLTQAAALVDSTSPLRCICGRLRRACANGHV